MTHEEMHCGCHKCNWSRAEESRVWYAPYSVGMIVCPECGNKRCPRATSHENRCTGSNEPNQPGSRYGGVA